MENKKLRLQIVNGLTARSTRLLVKGIWPSSKNVLDSFSTFKKYLTALSKGVPDSALIECNKSYTAFNLDW